MRRRARDSLSAITFSATRMDLIESAAQKGWRKQQRGPALHKPGPLGVKVRDRPGLQERAFVRRL